MRKYTKDDNAEWRDKLFNRTNENAETELDQDQKRIKDAIGTIWGLLEKRRLELDKEIAEFGKKPRPLSDQDKDAVRWAYFNWSSNINALDLISAMIQGSDHPIFRFVEASRTRNTKGRPIPSLREHHIRSLVASFIHEAPTVLTISQSKAAETASGQFKLLGLEPRTANATRAYEGSGFGVWGDELFRKFCNELKEVPAEKLLPYFRLVLAKFHNANAIVKALELNHKSTSALDEKPPLFSSDKL